jgi:acetyltransferase-like isoleucine patch superfamily enzyme
MNLRRYKQVVKYSWIHSGEIKNEERKGFVYRIRIFFDIVFCFFRYKMWSNQYLKEKFYNKSKEERIELGQSFLIKGKERDTWQREFISNRKFLNKYSQKKYELPRYRDKRNRAYAKRYNMGKNCLVEYDVELTRQHYLPGSIKIGDNVLLAKHVFIDYSGTIIIKDGVKIAGGVMIESHHRDLDAYKMGLDVNIPTKLTIEENAYIGIRAIILDSCNYIGKNARIGAGAVITKDIPDYATAVGVPAKVIRINKKTEV